MLKKKVAKHIHKVVNVKTMKTLKWGSVLAGLTCLGVTFILREHHMLSAAISAGVYEGSKLAQEFLEPVIRTLENLTEGSEAVVAEVVEEVEAAMEA